MTGKLDGPRDLGAGEFESLAELLGICFGGGEVDSWPHVCREEPEYRDRYRVFSDKARIVSSAALVPMELSIEGSTLPITGISIVATHPEYRSRGLASACVRAALSEAKRRGSAMAWLNGSRQLYLPFGFERAARKYNFRFDRRSVRSLPASDASVDEIVSYRGEDELVSGIARLYDQRELRGVRDLDFARMLLSRTGCETTVAMKQREVVGYITAHRSTGDPKYAEVYEYGGDSAAFGVLMRHRLEASEVERVAMSAPILPDDAQPAVFAGASEWNTGHSGWQYSGGMVKILDLRKTLEAFVGQMTRKRRECSSTTESTIAIDIAESEETATIECSDTIRVTQKRSEHAVSIDERDLVRELFGLERTHHPDLSNSVLGVVTPLDFYVSPLEMV